LQAGTLSLHTRNLYFAERDVQVQLVHLNEQFCVVLTLIQGGPTCMATFRDYRSDWNVFRRWLVLF